MIMEMMTCKCSSRGIEGLGLYTLVGAIYIAVVVINFVVAGMIKGCDPPDGSDIDHPLLQQQTAAWLAAGLNLAGFLGSNFYYMRVRRSWKDYPFLQWSVKIGFIAAGALAFLFTATVYGYTLTIEHVCATIENVDILRMWSVWAVYLNLIMLALAHMGAKKKMHIMNDSMKKDQEEEPLISVKTDGGNSQESNLINRMNPDLKF